MRVVILGGTFNPIHNGHLRMAYEIQDQFGFDKVLFVPTIKPTHKIITDKISAEMRIEMVRLALKESNRDDFILETCLDIKPEGIEFSIDAINCIRKKYVLSENPFLVIGDDLFKNFSSWKDLKDILNKSQILVAHRLYEKQIPFQYKHQYINNKIFSLSSSEIREKVKQGSSIDFLVPCSVKDYIQKNNLYV